MREEHRTAVVGMGVTLLAVDAKSKIKSSVSLQCLDANYSVNW
jgi:hypothetical protein